MGNFRTPGSRSCGGDDKSRYLSSTARGNDVAIAHVRFRVMAACAECGNENAAGARFCSSCGEPVVARRPERRKVATLLFCDVVGSTALAERVDAEAVREIMVSYFERSRAAIERHGGVVEKFVGDAVVAVFGVPVAHEDDAARAVRAASELQAGMAELNRELEARHGRGIALRIGLNTDEVVTGDASARQSVVVGDAVNVAARLEQHAAAGETLLGESTHRLVRDVVEVEPVDPIPAKGKSAPVRAVRLLSVRGARAPRAGRLDVPMIGREPELAALRRAFDEAVARDSCRFVALVGEPGVGKSRLADELSASLAGEATMISGRCLSYGRGRRTGRCARSSSRRQGSRRQSRRKVRSRASSRSWRTPTAARKQRRRLHRRSASVSVRRPRTRSRGPLAGCSRRWRRGGRSSSSSRISTGRNLRSSISSRAPPSVPAARF